MKKLIQVAGMALLAACIVGPAYTQTSGAAIYNAKCAMCHGSNGLAATPMAKSMKILSFKAPAMMKASNAQLFASTKNGKNRMPAYKGRLTDAQINEVVAYIRTLQK
ncbi:MAG: c-type cytochrome [Terracidiphilus sp.]